MTSPPDPPTAAAAERRHTRALARSLLLVQLVDQVLVDDLADGFTTDDEALEVLQGIAAASDFAYHVHDRPGGSA